MQPIRDYLTREGWKKDVDETRADIKNFTLSSEAELLYMGGYMALFGTVAHLGLNVFPSMSARENYPIRSCVLEYADKNRDTQLSTLEKDTLITHMGFNLVEFYSQEAARANSRHFLPSLVTDKHFVKALGEYQKQISDRNNNGTIDAEEEKRYSRLVKRDALKMEQRRDEANNASYHWSRYIIPGFFWMPAAIALINVGLISTTHGLVYLVDKLIKRYRKTKNKGSKK